MIPFETAADIMDKAASNNVQIILPEDVLITDEISDNAETETASIDEIPVDKRIVDIGALTISNFTRQLEKCRTVFWNGPMGIYEIPIFSEGTRDYRQHHRQPQRHYYYRRRFHGGDRNRDEAGGEDDLCFYRRRRFAAFPQR